MKELTPKEKAKELFNEFYQQIFDIDLGIDISKDEKRYNTTKQCVLITVREILKSHYRLLTDADEVNYQYYKEIEQEIEKL